LEIIDKCGLLGSKLVDFPVEENFKLASTNGRLLDDIMHYHLLIGRLIHLTITNPKLSYARHILS